MQILLILTGLPDKNSPARSVFNLHFAEELSAMGNEVTILYIRAFNPKRPLLKVYNFNGIYCYEVSCLIPKFRFLKSSIFSAWFFKLILNTKKLSRRLHQIEVIHAIGGGAVEASFLVSKKFKTPMLSQFIGSDLNVHFSNLLEKKYFKPGISQSSFICFNSKGLKDRFFDLVAYPKKTLVLYRGVKLDDFKFSFNKSYPLNILFLGGFPGNGNLKGGLTLIEAIKLLDKEVFDNEIEIVIGGPNSLNYTSLHQELSNNKIKLNIIGAINKKEVTERMRDANIVLIPSLAEGVPNVLYEAMASGCMVIASNIGGLPEIICTGENGILIKPNNPSALANTILIHIDNIDHVEEVALKARKRAKEFDYNDFIQNYIHVYKDTISSNL